MATALEATNSKDFSKQFSQLSISTVESVEETEIGQCIKYYLTKVFINKQSMMICVLYKECSVFGCK